MRIELGNVRARLVEAAPHEVGWVNEYLTYDNARARYARGTGDGTTRLLNSFDSSFPAGFLRSLQRAAQEAGLAVVVDDQRHRPCLPDPAADLGWLRDYQREAVDKCIAAQRGIVWIPTGGGKCLGKGTPVLRYDGRIVPVEAVRSGDLLMGPDSKPRRVLSTTQGHGPLFRIVPASGESWVCNDVHVMTLVDTRSWRMFDIELQRFLALSKEECRGYMLIRMRPDGRQHIPFNAVPIGPGDFYGFTLDGDGRFLLGDFTVTHNTEVAAALAKALPCSWLFVVPQADLLYQTAERFEKRTGEVAGVVGDGEWREARFTVATFQTLAAAIGGRSRLEKQHAAADLLGRVEGLIVDECHTAPADSIQSVLSRTRRAFYRIGLSGTPLARGDQKSLLAIGALGGIIHRIKPETLIAAGALSRPTIRVVPVVQASSRPTWQGAHGDLVVRSKQRNATVVNMVKGAQAPGFVFVTHVKHGKVLTKMLTEAGLRVEFVWGAHSTDLRSKVIERLVTGKLDFVVCSSVFQQAIDVPQLRSVINAAGGASAIATIQRIGRGTRVTADKTTFEAWDIVDRGNRWLERHTRERLRAYEGEGYQPKLAPEYSAPNEAGQVLDPQTVNAEAEYRKAQKVARDALQALTGETSVRRRR